MNIAWIALSLAIGLALGGFYFGGLWLTVRRLATSRQPALLMLSSLAIRGAVVLAAFYLLSGGGWDRLVACLVGFVMARTLLVHRFRPAEVPAAESR